VARVGPAVVVAVVGSAVVVAVVGSAVVVAVVGSAVVAAVVGSAVVVAVVGSAVVAAVVESVVVVAQSGVVHVLDSVAPSRNVHEVPKEDAGVVWLKVRRALPLLLPHPPPQTPHAPHSPTQSTIVFTFRRKYEWSLQPPLFVAMDRFFVFFVF
jgi:hypothetical protein